MNEKTSHKLIRWLIIIAMPFFLGFTWITLVIDPAYPTYEYAKADFPADLVSISPESIARLGLVPMTQAERLERALVAVDYLESWEAPHNVIRLLEEQTLPTTGATLYNADEISHMLDVKVLTDAIRLVALITAVLVIGGLTYLLWDVQTRPIAYRAIYQGGLATTIILLGIAGFILLGWSLFFVQFHELLFPPGTWQFAYTDGLIRMYPEVFFFDVGVIMSVGTLLLGLLVTAVGFILKRRAA